MYYINKTYFILRFDNKNIKYFKHLLPSMSNKLNEHELTHLVQHTITPEKFDYKVSSDLIINIVSKSYYYYKFFEFTDDMHSKLIDIDHNFILKIKKPSPKHQIQAVRINPYMLWKMANPCSEAIKEAIRVDPSLEISFGWRVLN